MKNTLFERIKTIYRRYEIIIQSIILTMDEEPEEQYEGIRRINARDWLLGIVD